MYTDCCGNILDTYSEVVPTCAKELSIEDFKKAKKMLEEAKVPEPYYISFVSGNIPPPAVKCNELRRTEEYLKESKAEMLFNLNYLDDFCETNPIALGNKARPCPCPIGWEAKKNEGNNPMRYDYDCSASVATSAANITVTETGDKDQRKYLMKRLDAAHSGFWYTLRSMFGDGNPVTPRTYKELLDAIQGGKFTLDTKITKKIDAAVADGDEWPYYEGSFYGIKFTDYPGFDHEGYATAQKEFEAAYKDAKDTINILPIADGLAALKEFEAFVPSNAPAKPTLQ